MYKITSSEQVDPMTHYTGHAVYSRYIHGSWTSNGVGSIGGKILEEGKIQAHVY